MTYKNTSHDLTIKETIQFTAMDNLCIFGMPSNQSIVVTQIAPGETKIIKIKINLHEGRGAYKFKYASKPEIL